MSTLTATDARKSFFELLKKANERHEIYHIHHRDGDAVLMACSDYEGLLETLELLSDPAFQQGLIKAQAEAAAEDTLSFDEVFGEPQ